MLLRGGLVMAFVAPFFSAACERPKGLPNAGEFFSSNLFVSGTTVDYVCDPGYDLLGNQQRTCQADSTWLPQALPFCVTNVAKGKTLYAPSFFSSVTNKARPADENCTSFTRGRTHFWYVDLGAVYRVQVLRLDFGDETTPSDLITAATAATVSIEMWVVNSAEFTEKKYLCSHFKGPLPYGRSLYVPCIKTLSGSYVTVRANSTKPLGLSICTFHVFSDQAMPVGERTPPTTPSTPHATETSIPGGEFFSYPLTKKVGLIVGVVVAATGAGFFGVCMVTYLARSICGKRRRDGRILNNALTPASSSRRPFVVEEPERNEGRLRSSSEPTLHSILARSSTRYQPYRASTSGASTSGTTRALAGTAQDVSSTSAEVTLPLSQTSTLSHQLINYRESCLL